MNPTFPPTLHVTDSSPVCISILRSVIADCHRSGFYCPNVSEIYEANAIVRVPNPFYGVDEFNLRTSSVNCTKQVLRLFCPSGYYCPGYTEKIPCPVSHYCGLGFDSPRFCEWGIIACPSRKMDGPLFFVLLGCFGFVLVSVLLLYYYLLRIQYIQENLNREHRGTASEDCECQITQASLNGGEVKKRHVLIESFDFQEVQQPLTVYFDQLSLHLSEKSSIFKSLLFWSRKDLVREDNTIGATLESDTRARKRILDNVFGVIKPYEITCILGPTGAGKTSLLNLLRGQVFHGECLGKVIVNGRELSSLHQLACQVAFVPQNDVLYTELTVDDNIMFAAMLFNKRGWTRSEEVLPMVYKAEQILGIDHVRFQVVGGEGEKERISGGQKKRVSIAMELVKEAPLLFLDEPTSGLDAATSISLVYSLKELASLGMNIVATLHQPRYEILELIHRVMVLAPGGRVAYHGSIENLRDHLMRFGYDCPLNANIADYVMDCLAGYQSLSVKSLHVSTESRQHSKRITNDLCKIWQAEEYDKFVTATPLDINEERTNEEQVQLTTTEFIVKSLGCFLTCFSRQKKIYFQTYQVTLVTSIILFVAGIAVGKLENSVRIENFYTASGIVISQTSFSQLVFSIFTSNIALQLFANDEAMRQREEAAGLPLVPLFVGKVAASSVEWLFFAFAFLSGYYSVIRSNTSFLDYLSIYVLLHLSISAMSNMMAIVMPRRIKNLGTLGLVVLLWLFGGIQPTNKKIPVAFPVIGPIINYLSPFRWAFELQITAETSHYSEIFYPLIQMILNSREYFLADRTTNRKMLVVNFIGYNFAALCLLILKRDNWLKVKSFGRNVLAYGKRNCLSVSDKNQQNLVRETKDEVADELGVIELFEHGGGGNEDRL